MLEITCQRTFKVTQMISDIPPTHIHNHSFSPHSTAKINTARKPLLTFQTSRSTSKDLKYRLENNKLSLANL